MADSLSVTRDSRVRIMLDKAKDDDVLPFAWRRVYAFNPDFHGDDYDPLAAARAHVDSALAEFPGHTATLEVLVTRNPDASPAEQHAEWRALKEG